MHKMVSGTSGDVEAGLSNFREPQLKQVEFIIYTTIMVMMSLVVFIVFLTDYEIRRSYAANRPENHGLPRQG